MVRNNRGGLVHEDPRFETALASNWLHHLIPGDQLSTLRHVTNTHSCPWLPPCPSLWCGLLYLRYTCPCSTSLARTRMLQWLRFAALFLLSALANLTPSGREAVWLFASFIFGLRGQSRGLYLQTSDTQSYAVLETTIRRQTSIMATVSLGSDICMRQAKNSAIIVTTFGLVLSLLFGGERTPHQVSFESDYYRLLETCPAAFGTIKYIYIY